MKKIKLLMFGLLSVLTLGLFVVTGTDVNAAIIINDASNTYMEYKTTSNSLSWDASKGTATSGKSWSSASDDLYGIVPINSFSYKSNPFFQLDKNETNRGIYLPVPSSSSTGTIHLDTNSTNSKKNHLALYNNGTVSETSGKNVTLSNATDDIEFSFDSSDVYSNNGSYYVGLVNLNEQGAYKFDKITITLGANQNYFYNVSFDANGGSTAATTIKVLAGGSISTLPTASGNGDFVGWYSDLDDENTLLTTATVINNNVTYYAKWEAKSKNIITFKVDNKTYSTKEVLISGDKKLTDWPTDPTKANATFDGWYDGDNKVGADTVFTDDTTLVAKFNLDTIAIGTTKTLSFDDSSLTVDDNNFYDSITYNKFSIDNTDLVIKKDSSFRFNDNGSIDKNYISFNISANSIAKIVFEKYRCTSKDKTVTLTISDGTTSKTVSTTGQTNLCRYTTFENTAESPKTIYIYKSGSNTVKLGVLKVSVSEYSTTKLNAVAELGFVAQYNGTQSKNYTDASKLRLVGTIYGIELADYQNIKSATFTFTFNEVNRTGSCTQLYSSVATVTELFSGGDNIMYVVFNLNNINKKSDGTNYDYSGLTITNLKFTVVFNDADNTTLEITHNNITLPAFAAA